MIVRAEITAGNVRDTGYPSARPLRGPGRRTRCLTLQDRLSTRSGSTFPPIGTPPTVIVRLVADTRTGCSGMSHWSGF